MARVAKTASEDLFALHLRGDCRRFTAIQQVVQSVYSLSKLFSGIALHGSKLTRGAQKIDSGCVQWDGEGFPELGCVLIPSHRPPPSITVVCGPHKPIMFWLFVAYDIKLGFVVLAWGDLSSHRLWVDSEGVDAWGCAGGLSGRRSDKLAGCTVGEAGCC